MLNAVVNAVVDLFPESYRVGNVVYRVVGHFIRYFVDQSNVGALPLSAFDEPLEDLFCGWNFGHQNLNYFTPEVLLVLHIQPVLGNKKNFHVFCIRYDVAVFGVFSNTKTTQCFKSTQLNREKKDHTTRNTSLYLQVGWVG